MKRLALLIFVVIHLWQNTLIAQVSGERLKQRADATTAFSPLKTTLAKLYPIEHSTISTIPSAVQPFAPRFCWEFFRPTPGSLTRFAEALRSYEGGIRWLFGPPEGSATCLVAVRSDISHFVGYPPMDQPNIVPTITSDERQPQAAEEFINQALADVPNLCSHLERYLGLERLSPQPFDPNLIAPKDPPSSEAVPVDFVERGMHAVWIVSASGDRRLLHFSVREMEWRSIRAYIEHSPANEVPERKFAEVFPLLSTIDETESTYFRGAEVESLKRECLRLRARATDTLAIRGLDKLIMMCIWADHLSGDIFLQAP